MANPSRKFVKLRTGALMPTLGMGTWHHGPKHEIHDALRYALDNGYRHIDCAKVYLNEKEVGEIFEEYIDKKIPRKDMFIIGKLWGTDHHPKDVEKACRDSMKDLKVDYLDLYLIHWPTPFEKDGDEMWPKHEDGSFRYADEIEITETWRAMEQLVLKGLVKAIGLSNFNSKQIKEIMVNCSMAPAAIHAENNPRFNNEGLRRFCERNGIVMIAYSPFGSPDLPWGEKMPHILVDPVLKKIADKYQRSTAQIVVRWLLQRGMATIPKSVIPSELSDNLKVYEFELTEYEVETIYTLNKNMRKIVPIVKLKSGEVVLRDGKSRHYPFTFEEPLDRVNPHYIE